VIFRVWAPEPFAKTVELVLDQHRRVPMRRQGSGWWSVEANGAAGTRYQFSVDGGEPLADPRSPHQPDGVFGPSAVVDHEAFRWTDARWQPPPLSSAIIYELHIGTFTAEGTFDGAIGRLDHLVELGVTHVEVMPVNEFAGARGWGYDGVLIWAPHHGYGGPAGFKRFVDACHARGLAVLLDVVYNHFGPEGNVTHRYGPYTTERYRTPWGPAVNLDGEWSDEVRRFFCDNALMWLRDYHCDGLRLDAVHAFADASAMHFLEQLGLETAALSASLGRSLVLIAESDLNDPRVIRSRDAGGWGMDAQWSDDFHHAVHVTLTGEQQGYYRDFVAGSDVARALQQGYVYQGQYSRFRKRSHGRSARLSGNQLVGFVQNHDQVGNRADGSRLSQVTSSERCRVAAALLFTSPFVPLLFQGEEWGASSPFPYFCDHQDPDLVRAVREGRQKEFAAFDFRPEDIPDAQAVETFTAARLCWEEIRRPQHAELLAWYRTLIALRRAEPDLADGRLERCSAHWNDVTRMLHVIRGPLQLICNLGTGPQSVPGGEVVAQSGHVAIDPLGGVTLSPDALVLLRSV
jgi:maltooligosyltrehalose trehalohydrolase